MARDFGVFLGICRRRERTRNTAHDAMRTWILVALRAATEPVKEEAMQAIFVLGLLCGVQRTCAGEWRCRGSISAFLQGKDFFVCDHEARGAVRVPGCPLESRDLGDWLPYKKLLFGRARDGDSISIVEMPSVASPGNRSGPANERP